MRAKLGLQQDGRGDDKEQTVDDGVAHQDGDQQSRLIFGQRFNAFSNRRVTASKFGPVGSRQTEQHGLGARKNPDKPKRGKVKSKGRRSTHITVAREVVRGTALGSTPTGLRCVPLQRLIRHQARV